MHYFDLLAFIVFLPSKMLMITKQFIAILLYKYFFLYTALINLFSIFLTIRSYAESINDLSDLKPVR